MTSMRFENSVAPFRARPLPCQWLGPVALGLAAGTGFVGGRAPLAAFFVRRAAEELGGNGSRYDACYHPDDILRRYALLVSDVSAEAALQEMYV